MQAPPIGSQQQTQPREASPPSRPPIPGGVGAVRDTVAPAPAAAAAAQQEPPGVFERGVRAVFGFFCRIAAPIWNFIARILRPIGNFFINAKNKIMGWFSPPKPVEPPAAPPQPQQQQPNPTPPPAPPAQQPPATNDPFIGTGWTAESLLGVLRQEAVPADPDLLFHIFESIVNDTRKTAIYKKLGKDSLIWSHEWAGRELLRNNLELLRGYLIGPLEAYIKAR